MKSSQIKSGKPEIHFNLKKLSIVLISLTFCFLTSCQKNLITNKDDIDLMKAQNWYHDQAREMKNFIQLDGIGTITMQENPLWEKANKAEVGDGTIVITVPVETNIFSTIKQSGNLYLVIAFKDNQYRSRYIGNTKTETTTRSTAQLYDVAFSHPEQLSQDKSQNTNNTTNRVACTDWTWVTKSFQDGEWVVVMEEYIGRTCTTGEFGGGGTGSENPTGTPPDGDFGIDPNCKNCVISADNFLPYKAYLRNTGMGTKSYSSTVYRNGMQYQGQIVQFYSPEGALMITYFSPNTTSSELTAGFFYSIGNNGPDAANNTNPNVISTIILSNGVTWNVGTTTTDNGGSFQGTTYTRSSEILFLISTLGLNSTEISFLDSHYKHADRLVNYLAVNGSNANNQAFAKWSIERWITGSTISIFHLDNVYDAIRYQNYLPRDKAPQTTPRRNSFTAADGSADFSSLTETTPRFLYNNGQQTANVEAFNCHYYAWYGLQYATLVDDDNPKWVYNIRINTSTDFDLVTGPVHVGDRITYYQNYQGKLDFTHSAIVVQVDQDGYATKASSKMGTYEIIEHHPRDVPAAYGLTDPSFQINGTTFPSRIYWRKK